MTARCAAVAGATSVLLALANLVALPQRPTFSSGVEAVRVDVLVTDAGRPVAGLGPEDFEVFDNGIAQRVDLVDPLQMPLNVVFVFDLSASVAGEPLSQLKVASRAVLDGLRPEDRVGLIGFSDAVRLGSALTRDRARIAASLSEVSPGGGTSLVDAAFAGMMVAESEPGRSLVIVFTDGLDTGSWLAPDAATDIARRTGVVVYGVSAGATQTSSFLREIGDATGGRLIEVETTRNLHGVFVQILEEFRHRYVLAFSPRGVSRDGWHALRVRVKDRGVSVKARPGYFAEGRESHR
jgi:VWFA-related protein